jgi:HK97 family phage major capsid protein
MLVETKAPETPTWSRAGMSEGFGTLGEFLQAVSEWEVTKGEGGHPRLEAAASGANETFPAEGGFLVQPDLAQQLALRMYQTGEILSRVQHVPIGKRSNGLKINTVDEDSRADGSRWGGVRAYWSNEGYATTPSKPKLRQIKLLLQKLIAICYATNELIEDAEALESLLVRGFTEEMLFAVEDAIFNGSGAGEPLGILTGGAAYEVTPDSGDSGATISTNDVLNMWQHLWPPSQAEAAWFINKDVEQKLYPLAMPAGTASVLLYTPPGQSGDRYGRLLGRPVIPVEHCPTLGTPGDIILADLSQYVLIDKGGPTKNFSIHVNFLTDESVFRFTYRVDGQPVWKKPVTPKNGTNQLAPFVFLAARS